MFRILLISLILVGSHPLPAQAGLLEFFFPSLRSDESDPTRGGYAPFAEAPENASESGFLERIPEGTQPLDQSHRPSNEISEWVADAVVESLNFNEAAYKDDFAGSVKYFTDAGRAQYETFLREKKIYDVLRSGRFYVRSYVEDTPLLLNEGAVNGVYRWLYRVPVVATYMDREMESYEEAEPVSHRFTLDVQVGRTHANRAVDGLIVETWGGKVEAMR